MLDINDKYKKALEYHGSENQLNHMYLERKEFVDELQNCNYAGNAITKSDISRLEEEAAD